MKYVLIGLGIIVIVLAAVIMFAIYKVTKNNEVWKRFYERFIKEFDDPISSEELLVLCNRLFIFCMIGYLAGMILCMLGGLL